MYHNDTVVSFATIYSRKSNTLVKCLHENMDDYSFETKHNSKENFMMLHEEVKQKLYRPFHRTPLNETVIDRQLFIKAEVGLPPCIGQCVHCI